MGLGKASRPSEKKESKSTISRVLGGAKDALPFLPGLSGALPAVKVVGAGLEYGQRPLKAAFVGIDSAAQNALLAAQGRPQAKFEIGVGDALRGKDGGFGNILRDQRIAPRAAGAAGRGDNYDKAYQNLLSDYNNYEGTFAGPRGVKAGEQIFRYGASLAGEVATDPTNFIGVGVATGGRSAARLTSKELATHIVEGTTKRVAAGQVSKELLDEATKVAAKIAVEGKGSLRKAEFAILDEVGIATRRSLVAGRGLNAIDIPHTEGIANVLDGLFSVGSETRNRGLQKLGQATQKATVRPVAGRLRDLAIDVIDNPTPEAINRLITSRALTGVRREVPATADAIVGEFVHQAVGKSGLDEKAWGAVLRAADKDGKSKLFLAQEILLRKPGHPIGDVVEAVIEQAESHSDDFGRAIRYGSDGLPQPQLRERIETALVDWVENQGEVARRNRLGNYATKLDNRSPIDVVLREITKETTDVVANIKGEEVANLLFAAGSNAKSLAPKPEVPEHLIKILTDAVQARGELKGARLTKSYLPDALQARGREARDAAQETLNFIEERSFKSEIFHGVEGNDKLALARKVDQVMARIGAGSATDNVTDILDLGLNPSKVVAAEAAVANVRSDVQQTKKMLDHVLARHDEILLKGKVNPAKREAIRTSSNRVADLKEQVAHFETKLTEATQRSTVAHEQLRGQFGTVKEMLSDQAVTYYRGAEVATEVASAQADMVVSTLALEQARLDAIQVGLDEHIDAVKTASKAARRPVPVATDIANRALQDSFGDPIDIAGRLRINQRETITELASRFDLHRGQDATEDWVRNALTIDKRNVVELADGTVFTPDLYSFMTRTADGDSVIKTYKAFNDLTKLWRASVFMMPGFSNRNWFGGFLNNLSDGVQIGDYKLAGEIQRHLMDDEIKGLASTAVGIMPDGSLSRGLGKYAKQLKVTADELASALVTNGSIFGQGIERNSAFEPNRLLRRLGRIQKFMDEGNSANKILKGNPLSSKVLFTGDLKMIKAPAEANLRLSHYIALRRQGYLHNSAIDRVMTLHIDYQDLSRLDINAKKLYPFFVYRTRALPAQTELLLTRGGVARRQVLLAAKSQEEGREEDSVPPFLGPSALSLGGDSFLPVNQFSAAGNAVDQYAKIASALSNPQDASGLRQVATRDLGIIGDLNPILQALTGGPRQQSTTDTVQGVVPPAGTFFGTRDSKSLQGDLAKIINLLGFPVARSYEGN